MVQESTQLTTMEGYNPKTRLQFSPVKEGSVPDSKPEIRFKRIWIKTKNNDGTIGDLIIPTSKLFSFGVSENVSQETGKVTGYVFPICLYGRDGPSKEEKIWVEKFNEIVEQCIEHAIENRDELELYELERSELTKSKGGLNPLYWKKEKYTDPETGKTMMRKVPDRGPTLYSKLMYFKNEDKFNTKFYDTDDKEMNPRELMGQKCFAESAIKIESIFISGTGKVSLQVKLHEAIVETLGGPPKRLLSRPKSQSMVRAAKEATSAANLVGDDFVDLGGDEEDNGSLAGDDDAQIDDDTQIDDTQIDDQKEEKPKKPKKIVKKIQTKPKKVVKKSE